MRYKKTLMLTIILAFIITISAASAADAVGTCDDALLSVQNQNGVGDSQEDVFRDNSSFIDNPNEPPIVEEDEVPEVDTFDDLQTQISNVEEGGVLCLTKDYEYVEGSTEGFNILKSITIDGQGHVIDCKKQSGAFKIVASNVTLKNISFRNCHDLVKFLGENNTIVNSSFTDCCDGGCLIYITSPGNLISGCEFRDCSNVKIIECSGDGNVISDSTFINCSFSSNDHISGGFVNFRSSNNSFVNSSFENCSVYSNREMMGGFIYFHGSKNKLIKSSFINSHVTCNDYDLSGGIVAFYLGEENLISETMFDNCYSWGVGLMGGIVMTYGADCSIVKSSFINCSAHKRGGEDFWGGIIYLGASGNVTESSFIDCTACFEGYVSGEDHFAIYGGVIYTFWASDCIISKSNFTNCDAELGCPNYYANGGVIHFNQGIDNLLVDCKFANCNLKGTSPRVSSLVSSHIFEVPSGTVRDSSFVGCNGYNEIILDTYYRNASIQNCPTVKIIKLEASNVNVAYDSGKTYSIRVLSNYKPADSKSVTVKLNGKAFKTIQTNSKGIASFKIALAPGTYKLTITALGKTLTRTLTVKNIVTLKTVTLKKSAKTLTLQASLAKVNGKYLKNKLITFKINGKKVAAAKTNAKGVAKITIKNPNVVKNLKAGKKVIYQAIYLKDTVEKTATIKK